MVIIIAILGLLLGSFYNVVGVRVPKKQSIIHPPSHCPQCERRLSTHELIPLLSYLYLKGRCKGCRTKISPIYPLAEWMNALLFVGAFLMLGWSEELVEAWLLISLLVIICISDIHYQLIPDRVLLFFGVSFLLIRIMWIPLSPWWDMLLGASIGFMIPFSMAVISKGGMGGGDIKLFAVLGLVLGWKLTLLSFLLASLCGTIFGLLGLLTGQVKKGSPIAFGPYIALGSLIAYFFGEGMVSWYLQLFTY